MEYFAKLLSGTLSLFKLPVTIFGFTFSFWEVFCFVIVAGIIAYIIGGLFSGN